MEATPKQESGSDKAKVRVPNGAAILARSGVARRFEDIRRGQIVSACSWSSTAASHEVAFDRKSVPAEKIARVHVPKGTGAIVGLEVGVGLDFLVIRSLQHWNPIRATGCGSSSGTPTLLGESELRRGGSPDREALVPSTERPARTRGNRAEPGGGGIRR